MLNITEGSQRPSERVIIYAIASTFLWSIVGGGAAADDEENVEMIISPARAIAICEKINKHNEWSCSFSFCFVGRWTARERSEEKACMQEVILAV